MKLPKGFSSKYLSQKNATELLLAGAKKWGIELNSQIATDVGIKFKHDMKFFNRDNIYPMWIMQGLKCDEISNRIEEIVLYCDMERGLCYYMNVNDCTIFRLPQPLLIKSVTLERKEKSNNVIYDPKKS